MSESNFIKGDRGVAGERGRQGDHGQDGRQGVQGEPGEPGTVGRTGRRGPSILGTDRRLVFLFLYVTAGMVFVFTVLGVRVSDENATRRAQHTKDLQFERQIITNCQQLNAAHEKFNAFLDQSIKNSLRTKGLTREQKRQSVKAESALKLYIAECPPRP